MSPKARELENKLCLIRLLSPTQALKYIIEPFLQ